MLKFVLGRLVKCGSTAFLAVSESPMSGRCSVVSLLHVFCLSFVMPLTRSSCHPGRGTRRRSASRLRGGACVLLVRFVRSRYRHRQGRTQRSAVRDLLWKGYYVVSVRHSQYHCHSDRHCRHAGCRRSRSYRYRHRFLRRISL